MATVIENIETLRYRDQINELRKTLSASVSVKLSDDYLLRFLKVAYFNMTEAEDLALANIRRRDLFQFDTITKQSVKPEPIERADFVSFLGFDKEGIPVMYVSLGTADLMGFLNTLCAFDMCMYAAQWIEIAMEKQKDFAEELGKELPGDLNVIFDFHGCHFGVFFNKLVLETGIDLISKFQAMYPGILKRTTLTNAPCWLAKIINIIKPIIAFETFGKITICSRDSSLNELLKYIDADTIPAFLGGNRMDENGDQKCSSFIKLGSKIPEEDYAIHRPLFQLSDADVSQITIQAGRMEDFAVRVDQPGSKLHVQFQGSHTIAFWLLFRRKNSSQKELTPSSYKTTDGHAAEGLLIEMKVHAHIVPLSYIFHCGREGFYICRFDNSSSWTTSKQIAYKIKILPPSSEPQEK